MKKIQKEIETKIFYLMNQDRKVSKESKVNMNGCEHLRVYAFLVIVDNLAMQLLKRRDAYKQYHDIFVLLTDMSTTFSGNFAE